MIEFKNSETAKNLMRAFAGESQARNRYIIAAGIASQQKLPIVEQVFKFTADQEKEHATIFYNHLKELNGEVISIDGSYPVNNSSSIPELVKAAAANEFEEYDTVYKAFAKTAKEEGFGQVASSFEMIAAIEKTHGERFNEIADMMEKNILFASTEVESWMCLNCGHIHTGAKVPLFCPVCQHEQGYFIRQTKAPYTC
ncbi:MAG: rubrerythrin family protein [Clostridia bacterium]|nr:rubrerythrin family protein [Clostridia bacterium]